MFLRILSTFSLCALSSLLFAQSETTFLDDFNSNRNNWSETENNNASSKILGGKYIIQNKTRNSSYFFWHEFQFSSKENYSIEAKLRQVSGPDSLEYGISWGASKWSNNYNLSISSKGTYHVWCYKDGQRIDWKEGLLQGNIKPFREDNILKISKINNTFTYYINGAPVFQHPAERLYGPLTGFIIDQQVTVEVDYIKLIYPRKSINLVKNINPAYKKKNVGRSINSVYSEIAPIISPDGQTLYVARQNHPDNFGSKKLYDVWYATRNADDSWSQLKRMGKPINNEGDNLVISVSPDGNTLLLEGLYSGTGGYISDQGISMSHRTENGWSIPQKVVIQDFYNLNEYESYCPTVDRKILIMSIEREDSYGMKDLYVSFRLPNGEYSQPFNMGEDLNTYLNEGTPFIAPDNKTLYFYSYGHPGYGSADIFVSKRLDNSWRKWSEPQNLGPAINSSDWDTYYSISAKGDYAYLVSSRNSYGNEDVFEIKLSEEARPDPVVLIYGRVFNKKTNSPIGVDIVYEDLNSGIKIGDARSNPGNGAYKIILPYGKSYSFRADGKRYVAVSEQVDLTKISKYQEIKRDLYLVPVEVGSIINLQNVQFIKSKAEFTVASYPELDRLVALMKEYPKMEIELAGHTDTRGNPQLLMALSLQRVAAVKNYLIDKGISQKRITGRGFGGTKPLGTGSEEIEIKNRRVEFKIKKM